MPETEPQITGTSVDKAKVIRRKTWCWGLVSLAVLFSAIQLIPYGRTHAANPSVTDIVAWDSPETEALVRGACFDCHSNETRWPWYSHVAPVSWLVQSDVDEGRVNLNFSEGNLKEIRKAAEVINEGEMPPWFYLPAHREARLSPEQKQLLVRGLRATFGDVVETDDANDRSNH